MPPLTVGKKAPTFTLTDKDGEAVSPDFKSVSYTVLFFYPKDNTPGCTIEAKEFSAALSKFSSQEVALFGISGGTDKTKASFCKKHSLKVPLLSDTDFKVAKAYDAFGPKKFMGRSYEGIFRKTFIIDSSGKIAHIFDSVKPEGHAREVLGVLEGL